MKIKRKFDHFNFFFPKLCKCFCYLLTSFCNYWEINLNKLLIFIYMLKSAVNMHKNYLISLHCSKKICSGSSYPCNLVSIWLSLDIFHFHFIFLEFFKITNYCLHHFHLIWIFFYLGKTHILGTDKVI